MMRALRAASAVPDANIAMPNEKLDMVDSNCDLAVRLGLKPYSEFEEAMAPLLRRLAPEARKEILEILYVLTAEKKVWESDKKELERQEGVFREQRKSVKSTRGHIKKARVRKS
jgi:hypothetical protein